MDHAPKVESLHQIDHIGRICVHVIAFARLAGTTVTTPVVRNHPIALTKKEHHLIVPIIGAERPAMMEHDCLRIFGARSEEHTSELQSLMRISYAVFCLKKKTQQIKKSNIHNEMNNNLHKEENSQLCIEDRIT